MAGVFAMKVERSKKCYAGLGVASNDSTITQRAARQRIAETTADLVDNILPHVPVEQWVLPFPKTLRGSFTTPLNCWVGVMRHAPLTVSVKCPLSEPANFC